MKALLALSSTVLCGLAIVACASDAPPEAGDGTDVDDTAIPPELQPHVTTSRIDKTFEDGCRINFWCHNDNAAQDGAAFCIVNACNGSAPAHAAAFCQSTCAGACSPITNFGACN